MNHHLIEAAMTVVYAVSWIHDGKNYSSVFVPVDVPNGIVMDLDPDRPGWYLGKTVSGNWVNVPIEGITSWFESWWKVFSREGDGGWGTEYTNDTERVGNQAQREVGKDHLWDEDGCYKQAKEIERPPQDANPKKIHHEDKRPPRYRD